MTTLEIQQVKEELMHSPPLDECGDTESSSHGICRSGLVSEDKNKLSTSARLFESSGNNRDVNSEFIEDYKLTSSVSNIYSENELQQESTSTKPAEPIPSANIVHDVSLSASEENIKMYAAVCSNTDEDVVLNNGGHEHQTEYSNSQRENNQIVYTTQKLYKCQLCFNTFSYKHVLAAHMRTHTGEKPFTCGVCQKHFSKASSLKRHKLIHAGIKPYKCSICNKRFRQSYDVKIHQRVHAFNAMNLV